MSSKGSDDVFVARLSAAGKLLWATSLGGHDNDYARGIAVSSAGRCSIAGHFGGTASFGSVSKTASGMSDIYVATLDSAGAFTEVRATGGAGVEFPSGIAVDGAGTRYVSGGFKGTTQLGGVSVKAKDMKSFFVWMVP